MAMNLQEHHVIPKELEDFLWEEKGIEWETFFFGATVLELQSGPHPQYTARIQKIIRKYLKHGDVGTLKVFKDNLIKLIKGSYASSFPDDIPETALEGCFPNVTPQSSTGRPLKPVIRN